MLEKIIRDFVMIWTTIDPISTLALFAGLTASLTAAERRGIAQRATFYAAIILVVAVVSGRSCSTPWEFVFFLSKSQVASFYSSLAFKCFLDRPAAKPVRTR